MKRFISLFLILAMCLCFMPTTGAARDFSYAEGLAEDLKALGLFQGVSDTDFDLDRAPTRVEALVMLIRLLGKDAVAKNSEMEHPFTDVPDWADGYVGYAYTTGLTKGISDTEFGTGNATIQMYLTFVLRSLDYSDSLGDFSYSEPYSLSYQTGILPDSVDRENFLRADVVIISYAALSAYIKNTGETLAMYLMTQGVFTENTFNTYYDKRAINDYQAAPQALTAEHIFAKCSPAVFYVEIYNKSGTLTSTGSGFFIDSNGTAVTNYHVIDGAYSAKVIVGDTDKSFDVLGVYDYDEETDWAVISVAGSGFDYLEIGDASTVVGGADVYAIGSPLGLQNTISQGLISNANRILNGISFIQTSAAISNGSSGGALINKYGKVIGITSAKFADGENLGLALPISVIEGYNSSSVTPLANLFGGTTTTPVAGGNTENRKEILDFIAAFVESECNESFDDGSIGYCVTTDTEEGYYEISLILSPDTGDISVLAYENYKGDIHYAELYITDPVDDMFFYYSYMPVGVFDGKIRTGSYVDARVYEDGDIIDYDEYEGNIPSQEMYQLLVSISSEYLSDIVYYLDYAVIGALNQDGYNYTIADLGFLRY